MERKAMALVSERSADISARLAVIGIAGALAYALALLALSAAAWLRGDMPQG